MALGALTMRDKEVAAHLFAPLGGPRADQADEQVRAVWARCRELAGTTEPLASAGLPDRLPADLAAGPDSGVLAVASSRDRSCQAVVRRAHDLACLSVLLAGPAESGAAESAVGEPAWPELERLLAALLGGPSGGLLGVAVLYLATVTGPEPCAGPELGSDEVGTLLAAELPGALQAGDWWHGRLEFPGPAVVCELAPRDQAGAERRFAVVASRAGEPGLSRLAWSGGGTTMPALACYLMHIGKARYQLRVRAAARPPSAELADRLDRQLAGVRQAADAIGRRGTSGAAERRDLRRRLAGLRADAMLAAERESRLSAMRRTVQIAGDNAVTALREVAGSRPVGPGRPALPWVGGAGGADPPAADFLSADQAMLRWLEGQIGDDIAYLGAARGGAGDVARGAQETTAAADDEETGAASPEFGIVTALPEEFAAMRELIDDPEPVTVAGDVNDYVAGTVPSPDRDRPHGVVLTLLGETGNDAAAAACANLLRSFPSVRYVLMSGIAAGVPDPGHPDRHVRLGDIVVASWGVVEYDSVTDETTGPVPRRPDPQPSTLLERRIRVLAAGDMVDNRPWEALIGQVGDRLPRFARPDPATDVIYASDASDEVIAHPDAALSGHRAGQPKVHYGLIGSGDRSLRSAVKRDEIAAAHHVLAIEMEAKGLGNAMASMGVQWHVVRGISDYGDRRANQQWRFYAALAAAAYVRALLASCPIQAGGGRHGQPGTRRADS